MTDYPLLVLHSHSHGDHVAGDGQFADRPLPRSLTRGSRPSPTTWGSRPTWTDQPAWTWVVGRWTASPVLATTRPRSLSTTRYTGLLLTGDTVYPGRLYVEDWPAFRATIDRLIAFAETHPVSHVLGCHIEMSTTPGVDYPIRTVVPARRAAAGDDS